MNTPAIETKPTVRTIVAPLSGARSYKLRAECDVDIERLLMLVPIYEFAESSVKTAQFVADSNELTLKLRTYTLDQVRDLCRKVEDGHVMLQTVQPEADYTGERNMDLFYDPSEDPSASDACTYKLRGEVGDDVKRLMEQVPLDDLVEFHYEDDAMELSITFRTLTLDQVRDLCRKVTDGHVMLQTVQPEDDYTGERNFSLE